MELRIYNPQDDGFIQKIEWNFEELKNEITVASEEYAVSVYTDDAIKAAKADRAKLNKFVDAMEAKRKELKKKVMVPYEQFEKEEGQERQREQTDEHEAAYRAGDKAGMDEEGFGADGKETEIQEDNQAEAGEGG